MSDKDQGDLMRIPDEPLPEETPTVATPLSARELAEEIDKIIPDGDQMDTLQPIKIITKDKK